MKNWENKLLLVFLLFTLINGCRKPPRGISIDLPEAYILHKILQGQQYSNQTKFEVFEKQELNFVAKFDSSAIYRTLIPSNQYDINKLYGFADNGEHHQVFSARFGWRWNDGKLRLFAYVYNNGIVANRELGIINIGYTQYCSIKVQGNSYIFSLNGVQTNMPRSSTTEKGKGYKLFPYFGGDETAPHDIHIWIKEN